MNISQQYVYQKIGEMFIELSAVRIDLAQAIEQNSQLNKIVNDLKAKEEQSVTPLKEVKKKSKT